MSVPRIGYAHAAALAIMLAEGTAVHARWLAERPEQYGDDVRRLVELGLFVPGPAYARALEVRALLRAELDAALAGRVRALVVPTLPVPAVVHGERHVIVGGARESVAVAVWRLVHPFNVTGHPALQVPAGFTAEGLPVGMQLAGARFDEATILGIGAASEAATGWHRRRPALDGEPPVSEADAPGPGGPAGGGAGRARTPSR